MLPIPLNLPLRSTGRLDHRALDEGRPERASVRSFHPIIVVGAVTEPPDVRRDDAAGSDAASHLPAQVAHLQVRSRDPQHLRTRGFLQRARQDQGLAARLSSCARLNTRGRFLPGRIWLSLDQWGCHQTTSVREPLISLYY